MNRFQKIGIVIATAVATIGQSGTALAEIQVVNPHQVTGGGFQTVINIITKVGGWMMSLAGALAVVYLIYGGIMYITGGEKGAEKAKQVIINAIIGLIIVALSYLIATVALNAITGA